MKLVFGAHYATILTVLTVLGMLLAIAALWPLHGVAAQWSSVMGLTLVYLAGGRDLVGGA